MNSACECVPEASTTALPTAITNRTRLSTD